MRAAEIRAITDLERRHWWFWERRQIIARHLRRPGAPSRRRWRAMIWRRSQNHQCRRSRSVMALISAARIGLPPVPAPGEDPAVEDDEAQHGHQAVGEDQYGDLQR